MYITCWIYGFLDIQIFSKSRQFVHIMYTISCSNQAILFIQCICRILIFNKSGHSIHLMYTISPWIFVILDIQIFGKSRQSIHLIYTNSHWIFAILYIKRVGDKDLSFCVGLKAPFTNNNAFEEKKVLGKAP